MKRVFFSILFAVALFAMGSCGKEPASHKIDIAESLLAEGDLDGARQQCQQLTDSTIDLTVGELCQVAMLYVRIAEIADDMSADMASAAHCYTRAMAMNADSVDIYLSEYPIDMQKHANMLRTLGNNVGTTDTLADEEYDEHIDYGDGFGEPEPENNK